MLKELPEHNNVTKCIAEVWRRERELEKVLDDHVIAQHAYDIAWSTEYLKAEGSIEARKATATVNTNEQFLEHLKAKAKATVMTAKMKDAQSVLNARQSLLSASAKADFAYANSRGTT